MTGARVSRDQVSRLPSGLIRLARLVAGIGLLSLAGAAAAGAVIHPAAATTALVAVSALLLLLKPDLAAVLAVAVLPFPAALPTNLSVIVSATDLLIVLALGGWLLQCVLLPESAARIPVLRPLRIPLAAYGAAMIISIALHPSFPALTTGLQRIELVVGGLLLGAGLVRVGRLRLSLELYLATASVLAVAAILGTGSEQFLGVQKNPAGGFIAAALLIAILVKPSPRWVLYAPILAVGLLATQSRGALVGALVAAAVGVFVVRSRERLRVLLGLSAMGALVVASYAYLPAAAQTRLLRFSESDDYAIRYREEFQADALDQFSAAPWTGVGVGNYVGGPRIPGITDPHQVLIFQLAEGGVPLLLAFLVLAIGSTWVVLRYSRRSPLAVAALTVQIATIVHAMADVYWVRGTPVPAWLLIGASLAVIGRARRADPLGLDWVSAAPSTARHRRTDEGDVGVPALRQSAAHGVPLA